MQRRITDENGEKSRTQLGFGGPATLEVITTFSALERTRFKEPKITHRDFYNFYSV